tara:strand:- start:142 stop:432 length:291 start_codon:yes stop_codon:yes gene_type:complete
MASNHQGPAGGFNQMALWNKIQSDMLEELKAAGQGSVDAFLMASFTLKDGVCRATVKGSATRHISDEHPAFTILNREGIGQGTSLTQAVRNALMDR